MAQAWRITGIVELVVAVVAGDAVAIAVAVGRGVARLRDGTA